MASANRVKGLLIFLVGLLLSACGGGGPGPTRADIEKAMRATWEHPASATQARTNIDFNTVKIGKAYPANAQDVVDGVPPDAEVTAALIDFTVRDHYTDRTAAVRRQREAKVYRDKFGEWAVMTGAARGTDTTTSEPASP